MRGAATLVLESFFAEDCLESSVTGGRRVRDALSPFAALFAVFIEN
jgi:hypothetical protein